MKYYEQLLESFNKLKKRTFKLTILEGEGATEQANVQAATQDAKDFLKNVTGKNIPVPGSNVTATKVESKNLGGYPQTTVSLTPTYYGTWTKGAADWADSKGRALVYGRPGSAGHQFISLFMEGGKDADTDKGKRKKREALPVPAGWEDQTPRMPGSAGYQALAEVLELRKSKKGGDHYRADVLEELVRDGYFEEVHKLWTELCGKGNILRHVESARKAGGLGMTTGINCLQLAQSFAGGGGQSLEKLFGVNMTFSKSGQVEAGSLEIALGNLKELMEMLKNYSEKGFDSEKDGEKLIRHLNNFKFTEDGEVALVLGEDGKGHSDTGIILRDTTGAFTGLMREAQDLLNSNKEDQEEAFEFKIQKIRKHEAELSASQMADERGKSLEILKSYRAAREDCVYWKRIIGHRNYGRRKGIMPSRKLGEIDLDAVANMSDATVQSKVHLACGASDELADDFTEHAKSFLAMHEWASSFVDGNHAINIEEHHLLRAIIDQLGGADAEGLHEIIGGLTDMSRKADDALGSDIAIPVGDVAKNLNVGDKDDAIHIWKADCGEGGDAPIEEANAKCNCDHASQKIMDAKGYDPADAQRPKARLVQNGLNDPLLKDSFGALGGRFSAYVSDKLEGGKIPLCIFRNGIKNTIHPLETTYIGVLKSMTSRLQGSSRASFVKKAENLEAIKRERDLTPEEEQELRKYRDGAAILKKTMDRYYPNEAETDPTKTELYKTWDDIIFRHEKAIDDLIPKKIVTHDDGTQTTYDDLDVHVAAIIAVAEASTDYRGQVTDELLRLRDSGKIEEHLETPKGRAYLAKFLKKYNLRQRVMQGDDGVLKTMFDDDGLFKAGDKDAERYLTAIKAGNFLTGGSVHKYTSIEVRSLATGEMISVRHNEMMDFMDDDTTIVKKGNDNTIRFEDPKDSKAYVEFELSRDHDKVKWASRVSPGWLRKHGMRHEGPELDTASRASLVTKYLDQQKKLFELLLS